MFEIYRNQVPWNVIEILFYLLVSQDVNEGVQETAHYYIGSSGALYIPINISIVDSLI